MKARDVMTTGAVAVRADDPVDEIAHLLVNKGIGAVPVVDDEGQVIGIITESDLFLKEKGIPFSAVKMPALFNQWVEPHRLAEIYANAHLHTAADIMTREVICVDVEDDVLDLARTMSRFNVERVPVLREGRLAGIITRGDLIRRWIQRMPEE